MSTILQRLSLPFCFLLVLAAAASAQVHSANFDAQSEGALGPSYLEDGILFSELDRYLGSGPTEWFVVEDASDTLAGMSGFSPPNTLGFGGWSPGPGAAFSRCGTFKITPPGTFNSASLALFLAGGGTAGNVVTLEARLAGALVASDAVVVPGGFGPHAFTLSVSGASFDTLHMVGTGSEHSGSFFGLVDSVQIGSVSLGTPYCFGDGTGAFCPCGNTGGTGEGCASSTGSGGTLAATGSASVASDDLLFHAAQHPPAVPALLFAGDSSVGGGAGLPFGDGLRCAAGSVQRLGVQTTDGAGAASWGPGIASSQGWTPGTTRFFQSWYRDITGPCGSGFNLSHGVELTFTP